MILQGSKITSTFQKLTDLVYKHSLDVGKGVQGWGLGCSFVIDKPDRYDSL